MKQTHLFPACRPFDRIIRDDIVQGVAAAIEGADVVADLESKLRDVRYLLGQGAPPRLDLPTVPDVVARL